MNINTCERCHADIDVERAYRYGICEHCDAEPRVTTLASSRVERATVEDELRPEDPAVGRWFMVKDDNTDKDGDPKLPWLGVITHLGSNYALLQLVGRPNGDGTYRGSLRVAMVDFNDRCTRIMNPSAIIDAEVGRAQTEVRQLMGKVQDITQQLSVGIEAKALPGGEVSALALRGADDGKRVTEYKAALIKAEKEQLPELFEQVRKTNERMSHWMTASLTGYEVEAEKLQPTIKAIKRRIANVELYAGLVEEIVQVRKGKPAAPHTKVYLYQRRHYMDEECLAEYETGGMRFDDLPAFDKWVARKENMERLLPKERCIVAFRVRREKYKGDEGLEDVPPLAAAYISFNREQFDKKTFLYIRNGSQLFRLSTAIDFGEKLFPDFDESRLTGQLYCVVDYREVKSVMSEGEYLERKKAEAEREAEHEREVAEWKRAPKAKRKTMFEPSYYPQDRDIEHARPFTPTDIYYDDMRDFVQGKIDEHNRLVLVLQGVLDRSEALHPHPAWQLWEAHDFEAAFELVYDDSRALVGGEKPDFAAYHTALNAKLKLGDIVFGQDGYWERVEAAKQNEHDRRHRHLKSWDRGYTTYRPYGNPGPGKFTKLTKLKKARRRESLLANPDAKDPETKAVFRWFAERQRYSRYSNTEERIPKTLSVPLSQLFNVSAYKPGDFKRFFADPRTRAEYLHWAPMMLEAEEWHAGNRKDKYREPVDTGSDAGESEEES